MTEKMDFKKTDRALYAGKVGVWGRVIVPEQRFVMIDGRGDPSGPAYARALAALYPIAYAVKFAQKAKGADFVVPPLEALWWAEDPAAFVAGDRGAWQWTAMLRMPDVVTTEDVEAAREVAMAKAAKKKVDAGALAEVRYARQTEGDCLQTLHVGPYTEEAPVLADLHDRVMPEAGLTFGRPHHEIYLSDPRRVAPEKLKTLLRQPVVPI